MLSIYKALLIYFAYIILGIIVNLFIIKQYGEKQMKITRQVRVGKVLVGGGAPIAIQSMSTFNPVDVSYAAAQINALGEAGADIVRMAVPNKQAAEALADLKKSNKSSSGCRYTF